MDHTLASKALKMRQIELLSILSMRCDRWDARIPRILFGLPAVAKRLRSTPQHDRQVSKKHKGSIRRTMLMVQRINCHSPNCQLPSNIAALFLISGVLFLGPRIIWRKIAIFMLSNTCQDRWRKGHSHVSVASAAS